MATNKFACPFTNYILQFHTKKRVNNYPNETKMNFMRQLSDECGVISFEFIFVFLCLKKERFPLLLGHVNQVKWTEE